MSLNLIAQTANFNNTYVINGKITDMDPMPTKLYLFGIQNVLDSTNVINGNYQFTEPFNEPISVKIMARLAPDNKLGIIDMASFYVNKGIINITSANRLDNFKLSGTGTEINNDYLSATVKSRRIVDSLKAVMHSTDFLTNKEKQASFRMAFSNVFKPMNDDLVAYLKDHPSTPAGSVMIEMIAELPFTNAQVVDSLLNTLPADQQAMAKPKIEAENAKKKAAADLKAANEKKGALGSQAIDFAEQDANGKEIKLSSFRGKYVLVDFWASWCGPCRAENPNVVIAYNKYKEKGFTVLGVSLDGSATREAWIKAIEKDGLVWTQVSDLNGWKNSAALAYRISSIPQNFLIDPNGIIVGRNLRGEDLEKKLATIFK